MFKKSICPAVAWGCCLWSALVVGNLRAEPPLPSISPQEAGFSPAGLEEFTALLQRHVEEQKLAGGVALVTRRGRIAYQVSVGWQDRDGEVPMQPDTLFRIASMTKPVTSVAVMMLHESGELSVDDPISKHIPQFAEVRVLTDNGARTRPPRQPMTIYHLLTHTSGLTYEMFQRAPVAKTYRALGIPGGLNPTPGTLEDHLPRLAKAPLLFDPGTAWEYGLSTDVLGLIVERASGQPLDQFFEERIFHPLDMEDTSFYLPESARSRLAILYRPGEDQRIVAARDEKDDSEASNLPNSFPYRAPKTYFSGGAGLVSTAEDYVRFLQMLLQQGEWRGKQLLRPASVEKMTRNQIGDLSPWIDSHGDKFGYGLDIVTIEPTSRTAPSVGAYSWGGIFNTYFWVDPREELVGILMTQIYPFDHLTIREDFQRAIYAALTDRAADGQ